MDLKKAGYLVLWLACAAGFTLKRGTTIATVAEIAFWGLVGIHLLQWLAFRDLMKGSRNGAVGDLIGTLLFGLVHVHEVRAELEASKSEG